jgi:hypothetical protein
MDIRFWQTLRLNQATARQAFDQAAAINPEVPANLGGRGIVIPGGGERYLPGAYVTAAMLRRHGCQLPIEVRHLGAKEMPERWLLPFRSVSASTVDAVALRARYPVRHLAGLELKACALVHCSFSEVLLLDADNLPVRDPTVLFESEPYRTHGAIFWPDYGPSRPALPTGALSRTHPIWTLTGVPYRGDREFESGQIYVDKRRCFRELVLTLWLNQYSDFWYRYLWGDKDTFYLAWRKLGREWAMPARDPVDLGGVVMGQSDFDGTVLFQHRNGAKWSLGENPRIPGFLFEDACLDLLAELRAMLAKGTATSS